MNTISAELRGFRTTRGVTQERLARALGISTGQLGHYEAGRNAPTVTVFRRMAQVLGWTSEKIGDLVLNSHYPVRKNGKKVRGRRLAA